MPRTEGRELAVHVTLSPSGSNANRLMSRLPQLDGTLTKKDEKEEYKDEINKLSTSFW